jgi:hypothetical protein
MSHKVLIWTNLLIFLMPLPCLAAEYLGILTVTPAYGFHSEKQPGGSFIPSSQTYSLQNTGDSPINWTVTHSSSAFLMPKTSGTLLPGQVDSVTVSVNTSYAFTPGISCSDIVYFNNTTNGQGNTSRAFDAVVIDTNQGILTVTPANGFSSEKQPGGSFIPSSQTYILRNTGGSPMNWTVTLASHSNSFLFSKSSGTLLVGQVDSMTVSVNTNYGFTPGVRFSDTIYFNNTTNTQGNTSRAVDAIVVDQTKGILTVTPAYGFHTQKQPGGSFVPSGQTYTLQNTGSSPLNWTVTLDSHSDAFLFSKASGTLLIGQVDSLAVSVNANYPFSPNVKFSDTIYFNNTTNTQGNTSCAADAIVIFPGSRSLPSVFLLLLGQ